jgi:hypothetical protein
MFEVTTLGQPLEVTKTTMAANRGDSFAGALTRIWGRGGILGCKLLAPNLQREVFLLIIAYLVNSLSRSHSMGLD